MWHEKSIFHLHYNDFEIQAERLLDPALRDRPVAVVSAVGCDAAVLSISDEARAEGLSPGQKLSLARKMAPRCVFLPGNAALYQAMNRDVLAALQGFSPTIEPSGFGRFYLDMSGMQRIFPDPYRAGDQIFGEVRRTANLVGRLGISRSRIVSAAITDLVPEKIHLVSVGEEPAFLAPFPRQILPVSSIREVGRIFEYLFIQQIRTVQEVTARLEVSRALFGEHGEEVHKQSRGEDDTPVRPPEHQDRLFFQEILPERTNDDKLLSAGVDRLASRFGAALRGRKVTARRVLFEIHYADGMKATTTGSIPYHDSDTVRNTLRRLFEKGRRRRIVIRSFQIEAFDFRPAYRQLTLFDSATPARIRLDSAIDGIKNLLIPFSCSPTST